VERVVLEVIAALDARGAHPIERGRRAKPPKTCRARRWRRRAPDVAGTVACCVASSSRAGRDLFLEPMDRKVG
jgi:hypothetical protein